MTAAPAFSARVIAFDGAMPMTVQAYSGLAIARLLTRRPANYAAPRGPAESGGQ